jgi:hypothetical protein
VATTGAVRAAARNRELEAFASMLLAALELPEVRRAVLHVVADSARRSAARNGGLAMTTIGARDLKASRLAARGRGSGG